MYPDLPIEQLVRRRDTRFQLGFATEAKELLPAKEEFLPAPSPKGLRVLARSEDALGSPVEILREIYMHVRISMEPRFLDAVKRALLERGAAPEEEYLRSRHCVLRPGGPRSRWHGGVDLAVFSSHSLQWS